MERGTELFEYTAFVMLASGGRLEFLITNKNDGKNVTSSNFFSSLPNTWEHGRLEKDFW